MNKKIVGLLKPFEIMQKFSVYEDGEYIDSFELKISEDECFSEILKYCQKYNINQIDLVGPKQYSRGIADEINKFALTNYQKQIEINII